MRKDAQTVSEEPAYQDPSSSGPSADRDFRDAHSALDSMTAGLSNLFHVSPLHPDYGDGGPDAESTISYDGTSGGFEHPSPEEGEEPVALFTPLLEVGQSGKTARELELEAALARSATEAVQARTEASHIATSVSHLEAVMRAQKEPPLDVDDIQDSSDEQAIPFGVLGIFEKASEAPLKQIARENARLHRHIDSGAEEPFEFHRATVVLMFELLTLLQKPIKCLTCNHWVVSEIVKMLLCLHQKH